MWVGYRNFAEPRFPGGSHTTDDWIAWLQQQEDVLLPVAPHHDHSCSACYGSSGYIDGGRRTWSHCAQCRRYGGAVDCYVPVTYSIDAGLESMLHRYKDFRDYGWLRFPLTSLLHEFVNRHGDCIDGQARWTIGRGHRRAIERTSGIQPSWRPTPRRRGR